MTTPTTPLAPLAPPRGPRMRLRPAILAVSLAVLVLAAAACSTLPTSGPVHHQVSAAAEATPAYNYAPRGPRAGEQPTEIVEDFLTAMQAVPASTAVARAYLTTRARTTWQPSRGTLVYEYHSLESNAAQDDVTARLAGVHQIDGRGGWVAGPGGRSKDVGFHLVQEDGEWRISSLPNALIVPESYFQGTFVPYDLYFFDQSERVVVPEQVYLPRGKQLATNLVRSLMAGPGAGMSDVLRSALPTPSGLDIAVTVSAAGVADVPLTQDLHLTPDELHRAYVQLVWTLGQVPGIHRVRITVQGTPVPLPDGSSDMSTDEGREFDPAALSSGKLLVLRDGRVGQLAGSSVRPIAGGLGRAGTSLRSLAQSVSGGAVAGVSVSGRQVYAGRTASGAAQLVYTGADVLRPAYDMFGDLWLIDRRPGGARVVVVEGGRARTVGVPGLTGTAVTAFAVSRDGTRLLAALGSGAPHLVVANLERQPNGAFHRATAATSIPVLAATLGPVIDLGWRTATTIEVLTRTSGRSQGAQLAQLPVDGSPGDGTPVTSATFAGTARALVVPADPNDRVLLVDSRARLYRLGTQGDWSTSYTAGVGAASY